MSDDHVETHRVSPQVLDPASRFLKTFHDRWSVFRPPIEERLTFFLGATGRHWNRELMIIGRAPNGWTTRPWSIERAESESGRIEVVKLALSAMDAAYARSQLADPCPMAWVLDCRVHPWHYKNANRGEYSTKRSAFWQVSDQVRRQIGIGADHNWPSYLSWTNLYKVSGFTGGNPKAELRRIQLPPATELLREEIRRSGPKRILFMTGADWFDDFRHNLGFEDSGRASGDYIDRIGKIGTAAVVVSKHPGRKRQRDVSAEIVRAFLMLSGAQADHGPDSTEPTTSVTSAGAVMNVWRLIAHHDNVERAIQRYRREQFIALGWGEIGDLRLLKPGCAEDIAVAIKRRYPGLQNAGQGGRCLWAFLQEVEHGDLVILGDGKTRTDVFEVLGDYYWENDVDLELGNYQHRRKVRTSARDPDRTWKNATPIQGDKWSPRWSFIRRGVF